MKGALRQAEERGRETILKKDINNGQQRQQRSADITQIFTLTFNRWRWRTHLLLVLFERSNFLLRDF